MQEIEAAIDAAYGGVALDQVTKALAGAYVAGAVAEETYAVLLDRIAARRAVGAAKKADSAPRRNTIFPPRRPQKPPVRAVAIERRRQVAASGALPPPTAAKFTTAELAVMSVVVGQIRTTKTGDCRLPIDALAAMAGCSRSTVKRALHVAADIGLVRVTLRPVEGRKNQTNIIAIIDRAVIAWIKRGPQRPISADRGSETRPHEYKLEKKGLPAGATETPEPDFRRSRRRRR